MLLAEDLLLLLTDDTTGKHVVGDPALGLGLAGGCVLELAFRGQVDLAQSGEEVRRGRLIVRDPSRTGDQVLDAALQQLSDRQGRKPASVLSSIAKGLRATLLERLAGNGLVRPERTRVLGIVPVTRWPAVDARHETDVRRQVAQVLIHGTTPDDRTRALIALLSAVDAAHRVVDGSSYGLTGRMIKKRARDIRDGEWAAGAVASAIEAIQAAVTAAVVASTVAATSSSGS
jgi:hypothetical protein